MKNLCVGAWSLGLLVTLTSILTAQQMDGDVCMRGNCVNGRGTMVFENGDKYIGQWKDEVFHGTGTYIGADGMRYEGQYVEGVKEGKGTYISPDGLKYVGQWRGGVRDGFGTLYRGKTVVYRGQWTDDRMMLE